MRLGAQGAGQYRKTPLIAQPFNCGRQEAAGEIVLWDNDQGHTERAHVLWIDEGLRATRVRQSMTNSPRRIGSASDSAARSLGSVSPTGRDSATATIASRSPARALNQYALER